MPDIVLGQYDYRENGSIYLPMGVNMQYDTSVNTQIHEMNHIHLDNMTTLGSLLKIFEIEKFNTPTDDKLHISAVTKYESIIRSRTNEVQEIYANCIELLLIGKLAGKEAAIKVYGQKNKQYKGYCDCMKFIIEDEKLEYLDKHHIINLLCFYSMNIDISADEFLRYFCNMNDLIQFLDGDNNPKRRLLYAIEQYEKKNEKRILELVRQQDTISVILKLSESSLIKYSKEYVNELKILKNQINENNISNDMINYWTDSYQDKIEEHIKVFDLANIEVVRDNDSFINIQNGIYIIKNCSNLEDKSKFYIIGHEVIDNNPTYISKELSEQELYILGKKLECICLSSYEFDFELMEPQYLRNLNIPKFVIFDEYLECEEWVEKKVVDGDFYIGNLYNNNTNNFFTVLFFADRKISDTVFIFPTTKILANRITNKIPKDKKIFYSEDKEFFVLLSMLENKLSIMKSIQWLLVFFTNSKSGFDAKKYVAAQLSFDLVKNILNSSLNLTEKENYKFRFLQPTYCTKAEPFYTVMLFKDNVNTGKIYAPDSKYMFVFRSKEIANEWINKYYTKDKDVEGEDNVVVGIDKKYWIALKGKLKIAKKEILICLKILPFRNMDNYEKYSVDELNQMFENY